jgi:tetratricopeptide (TPR) repeat protein
VTGYSTAEVARILGLSPGRVRGYVRAGLLSPERGEDGSMRFSFPDLVFLRKARGLMSARIPPRRIRRALERLREQLPEDRPLNAVRIEMEGSRIVVEDGERRWQPESGQAVFDFDGSEVPRDAPPVDVARPSFEESPRRESRGDAATADDWFELGCELETEDPKRARDAYEQALALEGDHASAHVNLGRLLHEAGDPAAAEPHYRRALEVRPEDATASYNLGVALEDLGKLPEALLEYQRAVRLEPENADAHYNAASLAERLGRSAEAVRHLAAYRRLTRR